jgi:hypothetical protein
MQNKTEVLARDLNAKNLKKIRAAFEEKRIDEDARDYLETLYSDGMERFLNLFYFLGRTLGAPKTPIYPYDPSTDAIVEKETAISDVGPAGTYIVHHRFDNDPMRNQFFNFDGSDVSLFVSSIVSVIVASQKSVGRAIDKIAGKYYDDYLADVLAAVGSVLSAHGKSASVRAVSDKIAGVFGAGFISNPARHVLKVIGNMFPDISVDLVRELDKVTPPFARLNDVYRMKLLFDAVPQINAFIEYVGGVIPDRVIAVKNKFYDLENTRGYRDAKIIIGFDCGGRMIPMEIICNVRTFFNAERASHTEYEAIRSGGKGGAKKLNELHHSGIVQYNGIICRAVRYLLHRVGWNILYEKELRIDSFFRGFPEISGLPYSQKIVDMILEKIENNVHNEVFRLPYAPRELSRSEQMSVFSYIARFILFAALPYGYKYEEQKNMGFSGKLFNFVMKELYRHYENDAL